METAKLELKDWKDVEIESIKQIRQGKILVALSTEALTLAELNIHKFNGETEAELAERLNKESTKKE